ncbi:hypothetical protein P7K49_006829 [Saguinus oedipus]|uniref:Uncharacterized protein n=1 Tax=Saguinus oedipus TaxID=9490 RepID=A0ABQ9W3J8_SAGOE|nr:hypothetical protein P7K49_006829 [Saguinus oedipus]
MLKSLQKASPKRRPHEKGKVHRKRSRNPRLSGRKRKWQLPLLLWRRECEQMLAAEPKVKDSFVHLPKSTFVLEAFKRKYSQVYTLSHCPVPGSTLIRMAGPCGIQNIPSRKHSLRHLTLSLITGMFKRVDKLRKMPLPMSASLEPGAPFVWSLGLLRPGACLSAESRLADGLPVIRMAETGYRKQGDSEAVWSLRFLGKGLLEYDKAFNQGEIVKWTSLAVAYLPASALQSDGAH